MAAELMVINPIRRSNRRKARPMTAKQRKYFGKRRKSPRRSRSHTRVTRARRNPILGGATSRRRRYAGRAKAAYSNFVSGTLVPNAIGAGGALLLDMAWGKLPIPDNLKTGPAAPITRVALAIALGYAARMFAGRATGDRIMSGALVVTFYDLAKSQMAPMVPATPATVSAFVDGLGYYSAARQAGMGAFTY